MKGTVLGLSLLFIATKVLADSTKLPHFAWDEKQSSDYAVPLLQIKFPDGGKDDFALLEEFNPIPEHLDDNKDSNPIDRCIYRGQLKHEPNVHISLTGCAGTGNFQIQFRSERLEDDMFMVHNGLVTAVKSPHGDGENRDILLEVPESEQAQERRKVDATMNDGSPANRDVPPGGLVLRLSMSYDKTWYTKFKTDSVNAMRRVLAHAQTAYNWNSLTTSIELKLVQIRSFTSETWSATSSMLNSVGASHSTSTSINAYAYMAYDGNSGGVIGIAWVRSTCHSNPKYRSSVNEWFRDDGTSGQVLAHELGHNLGMRHDFGSSPSVPRKDSKGNLCTGVGGIMDYRSPKNKWSTCSVEDLNSYYNSVRPFCLAPKPKSNLECRRFSARGNIALCPLSGGWRSTGCSCGYACGSWTTYFNLLCFCHVGCGPPYPLDWTAIHCCRSTKTSSPAITCSTSFRTGQVAYCPSGTTPTSCACGNKCGTWYASSNLCYCYGPTTCNPRPNWTSAECCKSAIAAQTLSCTNQFNFGYVAKCPSGYSATGCSCNKGCGSYTLYNTLCYCHSGCGSSMWTRARCCKHV